MATKPPSAIVHYEHRYKRPPPKRKKAQATMTAGPRIVTARKPGTHVVDAPDLTPEEHQRHGEAADALWRDIVQAVSAKRG